MNKYLVELTTLKPPPPKVPLLLYVAVAPKAVSAMLVQEVKEGETLKQWPVYYVSETLSGARAGYVIIEKLAYAVVMASRKLRRYFDDHEITVPTQFPIRDALENDKAPNRVLKWATELAQYNIKFVARKAVKSGVLADFIAE